MVSLLVGIFTASKRIKVFVQTSGSDAIWIMSSPLHHEEADLPRRHSLSSSDALIPTDPLAPDPTLALPVVENQHLTVRGVTVGLLIGTLACCSNSYFGLQTGWISMMSLPLSLLGFAVFKSFSKSLKTPFTAVENVLVQTVAVAVGTMPLAAGLVGIIPALEKLLLPQEGGPLSLSWGQLVVWSMGVAFFGVFFAVPLRRQVIIREKYFLWNRELTFRLRFPSGHATATVISVLHHKDHAEAASEASWQTKINSLLVSFGVSSLYVTTWNGKS